MTERSTPWRRRRPAPDLSPHVLIIPVIMLLGCGAALAQDDDRFGEHLAQAEMALQEQDYGRAAAEYRRAAELTENDDVAKQATRVAYTYGFNDDALASAKRWRELDPDSDEALLYVAQLHLRLGDLRTARKRFGELIELGEEAPEERLLSLIPILSEEDPENADKLMQRHDRHRVLAIGRLAIRMRQPPHQLIGILGILF